LYWLEKMNAEVESFLLLVGCEKNLSASPVDEKKKEQQPKLALLLSE